MPGLTPMPQQNWESPFSGLIEPNSMTPSAKNENLPVLKNVYRAYGVTAKVVLRSLVQYTLKIKTLDFCCALLFRGRRFSFWIGMMIMPVPLHR